MDQVIRQDAASDEVTHLREARTYAEEARATKPRAGHLLGERRHSFRVQVAGRASIWRKNQLHGHYVLSDLCLEGCSLRGGPSCPVGERVELVIHLPDLPPMWIGSQVRRATLAHSDGTDGVSVMALRFDPLPPRLEDLLQDLIVERYTRMQPDGESFSLIIEPRPELRAALLQSLESLGEHAIGVATPLDALQRLLERGERVHTVFIGSQPSTTGNVEIVEFLARHYPRVRRVLLGDARERGEAWLAEATGEVHALLEMPYSEDALRKLVHRISSLPAEALS